MSPAALLILKYLIRAEPFVTAGALLAWIRAEKRGYGIPTMRDYLVARSVTATVNISLLYFHFAHMHFHWLWAAYLYEYWIGYFIVAWFTLRVTGDVLQRFLSLSLGLQALANAIFRWVLLAAMLLVLPAGVGFAIVFVGAKPYLDVFYRFFVVISVAQLFPITSVMVVGHYARWRPNCRYFGILIAFCLEPAWMLTTNWFRSDGGVLIWTNLVLEIVCYAALGIWTWYAFHPDREDPLPTPNATLQHWDQLARKALRNRLPPVEDPEPLAQGARPWRQPHD